MNFGDEKKVLTVFLLLIAVSLIFYQVNRRMRWDASNRNYSLVTGYSDLSRASSLYGISGLELASKLKEEGLEAVLFRKDLAADGPDELEPVERFREAGFGVGLEIENLQLLDDSEARSLSNTIERIDPDYLLLRAVRDVVVPPTLESYIETKGVLLGTVEFRDKGLTRQLVKSDELSHVRFHRVFDEEVGSLTESERIARYVRAVEERNIGAIEYRLPLNVGLDEQLNSLEKVRGKLKASGYNAVPLSQAKGTGAAPDSRTWLSFLLIVSLIGAGVLLSFMGEKLSGKTALALIITLSALTSVGLLAAPILTKQVAALLLALGAPLLAYRLLKRYGFTNLSKRVPGRTYLDFLAVSLFSCFAGLAISSLLLDDLFILKLHQFRGVKASLFLPLAGLLLLGFYSRDFELSAISFSYGKVLAGAALLALFSFLLVRSGNFNFLNSTDLEEAIRSWLDSTFLVRPRFKEFLIGHPAMIGWLYLSGRSIEKLQFCKLGLFLLGFTGQVSIINTFIHVHTPIRVSLIRTANGLAGGLILGTGLLFFITGGIYLWKQLTE